MRYVALVFIFLLTGCTVVTGVGLGVGLGVGGVALGDSERIAKLPKEEDRGFTAVAFLERNGEKIQIPLIWQCQHKLSFSLGLGQWQRGWERTEDVIIKEVSKGRAYFYQTPSFCGFEQNTDLSINIYWVEDVQLIERIDVYSAKIQNTRVATMEGTTYIPNSNERRIESFVKSNRQKYVAMTQKFYEEKIWQESTEMSSYLSPLKELTVAPMQLFKGKPLGFADFSKRIYLSEVAYKLQLSINQGGLVKTQKNWMQGSANDFAKTKYFFSESRVTNEFDMQSSQESVNYKNEAIAVQNRTQIFDPETRNVVEFQTSTLPALWYK